MSEDYSDKIKRMSSQPTKDEVFYALLEDIKDVASRCTCDAEVKKALLAMARKARNSYARIS